MSFCSFAENTGMFDVTPIENMFLIEYLHVASAPQLRVYLYARMLCLHPELGNSIDDMAKALHMDVDAVIDAMLFWEQRGLAMRMSNNPPTYTIIPMRSGAPIVNPLESDYYEFQGLHSKLRALFPEGDLHAKQFELISDWIKILKFDEDAVVRLVQDVLEKSHSKKPNPYNIFRTANQKAIDLSNKYSGKAITFDLVEFEITNETKILNVVNAVLEQLSLHRQATKDELKLAELWIAELNMTKEEILAECQFVTNRRNPTLAHLDAEIRDKENRIYKQELLQAFAELGLSGFPTPTQIDIYKKMKKKGVSLEVICEAAKECNRESKRSFDELREKLLEWWDNSLTTIDAIKAHIHSQNTDTSEVRTILKKCGLKRSVNDDDIERYRKWKEISTDALIAYAIELARGKPNAIPYMNTVLNGWYESGIKTVDEARAQHEAHRGQKTPAGSAANPALQYEQRSSAETNYGSTVIDLLKEFGGEQA